MSELNLELDRDTFAPGEVLKGVAQWGLDSQPRSVEVRLFWFTQGKGTQDVGLVNKISFDLPSTGERRPFQFTLPESPYSFSGKLISLVWAVELVAQPGDLSGRVEIVVAPSGREVLLKELPGTT